MHYCDYSLHLNVNVNDSPVFTFARPCCLKIPMAKPACLAKVVSDLLDSSLVQGSDKTSKCGQMLSDAVFVVKRKEWWTENNLEI